MGHSQEGSLIVSLTAVAIVSIVALLSPLSVRVLRLPVPAIVLEILLGVVVGPQVLAWVHMDAALQVLSTIGLSFLLLLAGLNFFMGVFNLLPLLPLDGGHIAVIWYEHVRNWLRDRRGKTAAAPVDYTRLSGITMVLVLVGGAVMLLTVTADIVNPIRITQ